MAVIAAFVQRVDKKPMRPTVQNKSVSRSRKSVHAVRSAATVSIVTFQMTIAAFLEEKVYVEKSPKYAPGMRLVPAAAMDNSRQILVSWPAA